MVLVVPHGFLVERTVEKVGKKGKDPPNFCHNCLFLVGFFYEMSGKPCEKKKFLWKSKNWALFGVKRSSSVAYCAKSWGLKGESSDLQLSKISVHSL